MSQILSNFYPLAGRFNKEKQHVDCNDQGALFSTAQLNADLSLILKSHLDPQQQNHLLPVDATAADGPTHPILAVQINRFQCGGLAIAACVSHRVVDSASFSSFLAAWATAAETTGKLLIQPYFDHHSYFPAENPPPHDDGPDENIIAERYVFDSKAIKKLRQRLTTSEPPLSRVVAVSTFLVQALLRADITRRGKPRAALMGQLINIRERTVPPVPKNAFGTWLSGSFLDIAAEDTAAEAEGGNFPALASRIREATVQGVRDCARVLGDKEFGRKLLVDNFLDASKKGETEDCKVIWCTDFSKFGDYELDFGFGKPEWVSVAVMPLMDYIIMLNNRSNDGIEAWVCLQECDMQFFRQDKEILRLSAGTLG
ncbi:hypothetical protein SASPL_134000 [Salvia splendens]|uniref:Vinorine synthase n=2 Tax=Salvia splendens TaxID=180675 RepID=A0A8X8X640_SALSN|nr:hypothetical protein SASPL_134000 [Salvia splendens]